MKAKSPSRPAALVMALVAMLSVSSAHAGPFVDSLSESTVSNAAAPARASGRAGLDGSTARFEGSIKGGAGESLSFVVFDGDDEDPLADTVEFNLFLGDSVEPAGSIRYDILLVEIAGDRYLRFPFQSSEGVVPPLGEFFPFLPDPSTILVPVATGLDFSTDGGSLTVPLDDLPLLANLVFESSFEADEAQAGGKGNGALAPVLVAGSPGLIVDTNDNGLPEPDIDDRIDLRFAATDNVLVVRRGSDAYVFQAELMPELFLLQITEVLQYPLVGAAEVTNARTEGRLGLILDNVFLRP